MAHTLEYLEAIYRTAKSFLPTWVWDQLHKKAFPSSGGHASHRKEDLEKQIAPISSTGLTTQEIFAQLSVRGEQYSKTEAKYIEPSPNGRTACGACRFYLRSPIEERGLCQAVMGGIAWFGTCDFYIGASEEAEFALSNVLQKQGFEIQTIVFPKSKWTLARARKWLEDHDFKDTKVDETGNSYRFRQLEPGQFNRIRPLCLMPNGARPNLEDCSVLAFGGVIEKDNEKKLSQREIDKEIDKAEAEYDSLKPKRRTRKMEKDLPILKIDEEKRVVYGVVLDPYIVDTQGDWSPPSEVEKTAHGWMEISRTIGLRHKAEANAIPVESFLMPYPSDDDYKRAMGNRPHRVIKFKFGSGFVHSGSWVLGTKIRDEPTWVLVKSGELGSYSIGGHGERTEITTKAMPEVTETIEADWSKAA